MSSQMKPRIAWCLLKLRTFRSRPEKSVFFSQHLLKPSSITEESQVFLKMDCEFMISRCREAFSGARSTIHLLWSLNQADHCLPMIHGACMLKHNAFYHSTFYLYIRPPQLLIQTCCASYTTCTTFPVNSSVSILH